MIHLDRRSPLLIDGQRMPLKRFHQLPRVPGFKYEYWDGRARISLQHAAYPVVAARPSELAATPSPSLPDGVLVRHLEHVSQAASPGALKHLWIQAFRGAPEYTGYSEEAIDREVSRDLSRLLEGPTPEVHPASVVAVHGERPVGLLLITRRWACPDIHVLCIDRTFRRKGVARTLLALATKALVGEDASIVVSSFLLANYESGAWHAAMSFREMPCSLVLTHRLRCLEHNLAQGLVWDVYEARCRLRQMRERRSDMEAKQKDDLDAFRPHAWLRSNASRFEVYL